jgi:putative endonuclease
MTLSNATGNLAEQQALAFLQQQGLKRVAQNFRCKGGEIDIIALDQDTLVFIEVRLRQNKSYASAAESITKTKQRRILHAAQVFLMTHPHYQHCNLRFDGVLFTHLNQTPEWVQSAFDA